MYLALIIGLFAQILLPISSRQALPTDGTPTFSPGAGIYSSTQSVTISTVTSGATLCYTTDGSTPTATVPGTCDGNTYSTPLSVSTSQTIKAIATKLLTVNSAVGSAAYIITSLGATTNNFTYNDTGGTSHMTFNMPSTPTVGNSLLMGIVMGNTLTLTSCTDNQTPANTYTILASPSSGGTNRLYLVGAHVATASGTFTPSCTQSINNSAGRIVASEVTGLGSPITVDGTPTFTSGGITNCAPGSITLSHSPDLGIGIINFASTFSAGSGGWAIPTSASGLNMGLEYLVTSAGSINPPWTNSNGFTSYCLGAGLY